MKTKLFFLTLFKDLRAVNIPCISFLNLNYYAYEYKIQNKY